MSTDENLHLSQIISHCQEFGHNKTLLQITSARLLRYASFLSELDYLVKFAGNEN